MGETLLLLFLAAVGVVAVAVYVRERRLLRRPLGDQDRPPRCHGCGYDLSRLEMPRCPECGALRGFQVPLTELGLTEQEVRQCFAPRGEREADGGESSGEGDERAGE